MNPLQFPTQKDKNRLDGYDHFDRLYYGNHFDAFGIKAEDEFTKRYAKLRYIVGNYPGLMSRVMADMLFGERITFDAKDDKVQEYIDYFIERNQLKAQLYESALVNSRRGDSVFKLRVGTRGGGTELEVIAEEIPASIYFPALTMRSGRNDPESEVIAVHFKNGDKDYIHKEIHTPGLIVNEIYEYNPKEQKIVSQLTEDAVRDMGYQPTEETGVSSTLIFHIPNVRDGNGYFGTSDYGDLESLFFALNNRITKVDNILDKHSDPILALPPGVLDEDGKVRKEHLGMFEVDNENPGFNKPEYVTWNANLESAFAQIDKLMEMLFMFSEIAPATMGMDKDGKVESGRALKMKLLATIRKRNRKIRYYDHNIKKMLMVAQELARVNRIAKLPTEAESVNLTWGDGIVNDQVEMTDIAVKRVEAGLSTTADEIAKLDDITPAEAQEKAQEIKDSYEPMLPTLEKTENSDE